RPVLLADNNDAVSTKDDGGITRGEVVAWIALGLSVVAVGLAVWALVEADRVTTVEGSSAWTP
ncbi:hypothetical protein ACFL6C_10795, partial [Myxococcota bacterium]